MATEKTLIERIQASINFGNMFALQALLKRAYEKQDGDACVLAHEGLGTLPDKTDSLYWDAVNERDAEEKLRERTSIKPSIETSATNHVSRQKPREDYNMTLNDARRIVSDSTTKPEWRRSLVARYVSPEQADKLYAQYKSGNYSGLKREGDRIINYAKRLLGTSPKRENHGGK